MANVAEEKTVSLRIRLWVVSSAIIFLLFAVLSAIHSETLFSLIQWWGSTTKYGHAILIFPAIAYLIYDRRKDFIYLTPSPEPRLLFLLLVSVIGLFVFEFLSVQVLSETIIIVIFPLIVWIVLGNRIVSRIYIPLLLLFMVVPAWEIFSPSLTELTATIAHYCLNILGVPVLREGGYLTIPEGVFEIEEGCGGFRYFIAGLSLSLIYSYMFFESFKQRAIVVVAALIISIVINWLRVMIVIWAGHMTEMQHHFVEAHNMLGWWIFGGAFLLFFIISSRFSVVSSGRGVLYKDMDEESENNINITKSYIVGVCVLVVICMNPVARQMLHDKAERDYEDSEVISSLYGKVFGWEGPYLYEGDWNPNFIGADNEGIYIYKKGDFSLAVYIAYYAKQTQGKELINLNNRLMSKGWRPYSDQVHELVDEKGSSLKIMETRASASSGNKIVWSWYYISGWETSDHRLAKIMELRKLFVDSNLSAIIAVLPEENPGSEESERLLKQFLEIFRPQVKTVLDGY